MADDNKITMEKLVEEIQYQVPFKKTTEIGDTVLMLREEENGSIAASYARIMGFDRDPTKRDEWWQVHFVFLEVPPIPRSIFLQTPHFTGEEIFTMGGRKVFIKAVNFDLFRPEGSDEKNNQDNTKGESQQETANKKPTFTLVK